MYKEPKVRPPQLPNAIPIEAIPIARDLWSSGNQITAILLIPFRKNGYPNAIITENMIMTQN